MELSKGRRTAADFAIAYPEIIEALVFVAPGLSGYPFNSPELKKAQEPLAEAYKIVLDFLAPYAKRQNL